MREHRSKVTSPLLSIDQVAQRLGVNVRHVRRLVFERRIPYVKWGHLIRFDPAALERFIDEHTQEAIKIVGRA